MKKRIVFSAALLTFAFPAVAGATLVINSGMSGVSLGTTIKQVCYKLGRPSEIDRSGGTTTWFYSGRELSIDFRNRTAYVTYRPLVARSVPQAEWESALARRP